VSTPGKHQSCSMQRVSDDCGPRFIGEAVQLGMEEIAIATPDGEGLFVVRDAARVDIEDIGDEIEIHLFFPPEAEEHLSEETIECAQSVNYCESVETRLIANPNRVYIRKGTFDADRSRILETGRDHRCEHDADSPYEFLSEFLGLN